MSANNLPYQAARSLTVLHQQKKFYFYPYQHVTRSSLKNVLIVGAGTGNDVAVALSEGAQHVDAVEIDPILIKLGKSQHPNHPYDSPRVTTHNADGRAYLQNSTKKYNLILFALPDSLTAVNGQSSKAGMSVSKNVVLVLTRKPRRLAALSASRLQMTWSSDSTLIAMST